MAINKHLKRYKGKPSRDNRYHQPIKHVLDNHEPRNIITDTDNDIRDDSTIEDIPEYIELAENEYVSCDCGILTGEPTFGIRCSLCGSIARKYTAPTQSNIDPELTISESVNLDSSDADRECENISMSNEDKNEKVVVHINSNKSEGLSALSYAVGSIVVGIAIFAAAWYLKR